MACKALATKYYQFLLPFRCAVLSEPPLLQILSTHNTLLLFFSLNQGSAKFSFNLKALKLNILGFTGSFISISTTQFCHWGTKTCLGDGQTNGCSWLCSKTKTDSRSALTNWVELSHLHFRPFTFHIKQKMNSSWLSHILFPELFPVFVQIQGLVWRCFCFLGFFWWNCCWHWIPPVLVLSWECLISSLVLKYSFFGCRIQGQEFFPSAV